MANIEIGSAARAAETRVPLGLALIITFTILSSTSVALRLYTRKIILRLVAADDYVIIIAQILNLGMSAINIVCFTAAGVGRHAEFVADKAPIFVKCVLAAMSIYNATQIATKISLLLQYRRLFLGQAIQWTCKGGIIFLATWGVVQQIYTPFACGLITLILPKQKACLRPDIPFKLNAVMNMVTDFLILLIPIKPVLQLQVNRVRKMYLLIVLCFGLVVCGISALRLDLLVRASHAGADVTWDMAVTAYLSTIETCLGIMCASIPTLRPLIKKIAPILVGSSYKNTSAYGKDYGNTTRLNNLSSSKQKTAQGSGIYIHKEVEFQSTTELRVPYAKDPYSIPERSSDEVSLDQIQSVATAKIRDLPPQH